MADARQQRGRRARKEASQSRSQSASLDEQLRKLGEEILKEDVPEFLLETLRRAVEEKAKQKKQPDADAAEGAPNRPTRRAARP